MRKKSVLILISVICIAHCIFAFTGCSNDNTEDNQINGGNEQTDGGENNNETENSEHVHDWGDWVVVTPASCISEGLEKRTCKLDENHTETRDISKTQHKFNNENVCTVCGYSLGETENLAFELDTETGLYIVTGKGEATETQITIPSRHLGIQVFAIGDGAFKDCEEITDINIPEGISRIGANAFSGTALYNDQEKWTNNVLFIDGYLIKAKSSSVSGSYAVPNGTKLIADGAFLYCSDLTGATIPASVNYIGNNAFSFSGLRSINIANGVKSIGDDAFSYCTSLSSITVPDSVMEIGNGAFSYCTGLGSITLSSNLKGIKENSFHGCIRLQTMTLPDSISYIGKDSFHDCTALANINIPSNVERIDDNAFFGCQVITNLTIPAATASIGKNAFKNCTKLAGVTFEKASAWKVSKSEDMTDSQTINTGTAQDNAALLKSTYCDYYWKLN